MTRPFGLIERTSKRVETAQNKPIANFFSRLTTQIEVLLVTPNGGF